MAAAIPTATKTPITDQPIRLTLRRWTRYSFTGRRGGVPDASAADGWERPAAHSATTRGGDADAGVDTSTRDPMAAAPKRHKRVRNTAPRDKQTSEGTELRSVNASKIAPTILTTKKANSAQNATRNSFAVRDVMRYIKKNRPTGPR